jgi:hypothetical protein
MDPLGREDMSLDCFDQRAQRCCTGTNRQRGDLELDALARIDRALAIERQIGSIWRTTRARAVLAPQRFSWRAPRTEPYVRLSRIRLPRVCQTHDSWVLGCWHSNNQELPTGTIVITE